MRDSLETSSSPTLEATSPMPGGRFQAVANLELPPLPEPDYERKWNESKHGVLNVLFIITIILVLTNFVVLNQRVGTLPVVARWVCFLSIHAMAFLALLCLERVLRADPGVVERSDESCLPIPDSVRERLIERRSLDDLRNLYLDDETRGSYCVRCCVWRPPKRRSHHCSTCQRCVVDFDHHCGFYGRCIAGTWRTGNMPYFFALILLAWASVLVVLVFFVYALVHGPS
ncbi:hypothetical protein CTAYLR_000110 [Chrysophaeum taylorii]|uniref:Palmitoyltransferase n=1 Tax=Chrysophaeum taylorii TaxID=2483200 RepID=A0AAD7XND9_9STRA|nr:hypothetical protein CTAYLR_000110 [Chrysophaeum taylorii]